MIQGEGTAYATVWGQERNSIIEELQESKYGYCSPWGHKELDTTEQLNGTELNLGVWSNSLCKKGLQRTWCASDVRQVETALKSQRTKTQA